MFSNLKPEMESNLKRYGKSLSWGLVAQVEEDGLSLTDFRAQMSEQIEYDGMGESLFAVFLINLTTYGRVWKALGAGNVVWGNPGFFKDILGINSEFECLIKLEIIEMSFTRGDMLSKTVKLVKGQAKREPLWLKAMKENPPPTFPRPPHGKIKNMVFPEDHYVKQFFRKFPDSRYHDPIRVHGFDPPPSQTYAHRILKLTRQGVNEADAVAVAEMEYLEEKKAKKKAYKELKTVCRALGKKPPPTPFPSAIKEIQAEERKLVHERFTNPKILEIVRKMKEEKAMAIEMRKMKELD